MTQEFVRIAIAEDEPSVREALADLVSDEPSFELVGTANDTQQAVELVRTTRPDVLLCDVKMPGGGGPQVATEIRLCTPETKTLALSACEDRATVLEMVRAGAVGYLVKGVAPDEILDGVRHAAQGKGQLSRSVASHVDPVDVEDLIGEVLPSVREAARTAGVRLFVAGRGERTVAGATHGRLAEAITAVVLAAIGRCDRGGGMRISWNRTSGPRASIVIGCTGVAPPGVAADAFEDRPGSDGNSLRSALAGVRALEGDVLFEPSATGGTLTVDLPACGVAATRPPGELRQRRAYPTLDRPDDPCTVVYVEDNVSNRALVHDALAERVGVKLVLAASGRDGIELIKGCIPDLVLLDLNLPDMDGHDVLKECLAGPDTSQIPVVIVSADASPSVSRLLTASGASAFVTKPLDIPKFLEVIDATLRQVIDARSSVTPSASIRVAAGR